MKRATKRISLLLFIILIFVNQTKAKDVLEKEFSDLAENDIIPFSETLKKVCKSKSFFINLNKYNSLFGNETIWREKCNYLKKISLPKDLKDFLINNFKFRRLDSNVGLLTGYYEPVIKVSNTRNNVFKFPVLRKNKVYNKKSRKYIEANFKSEDVILWTDNEIDLFFLHIQGSGIGEFQDKKKVKIAYNGNNELNYTSIGKILLEHKYISSQNINLFTIKDWLFKNPGEARDILNKNKRFIFFKKLDVKIEAHPYGAFGIPLTPNYSIAVDKNIYPLGLPFLIKIKEDESVLPVVSLDTGSAIIGINRADLFLGRGKVAEQKAGTLKKKIYLYCFIPYNK